MCLNFTWKMLWQCLWSVQQNIGTHMAKNGSHKVRKMKGQYDMWRCPIKQHPKFLCEKNHISAMVSSKTFFSIQTLFSLNTKWFYFLGHHWPPRGLKIAKCLFSGSFQESHFRSDLHVGCHPEKFYIGFLSRNFFWSHYRCGEVRKKVWGEKSMLNFSG